MLLTSILRRARLVREENGSGLILVIVVMGVLLTLALLVASMSVHALGFTTSTRAGVQAKAAADAGIDYAAAQLSVGSSCSASYSAPTTAGSPIFTASVQYSLAATGDSWLPCPMAGAKALRVKITSTGTATAKGLAGQSANNTRKVEGIFAYNPSDPIPATGGAIYSYASGTYDNITLTSAPSVGPPDVMIKTGNFSCTTTNTKFGGSIWVAAGTATLNNNCTISKDLWASGALTIRNTAQVGRNALSAATGAAASFDNTPHVAGFLDLAGYGTTSSTRCPAPNNTWNLAGDKCAIQQNMVSGSVTFNDSTVRAPVVPDWLDYGYKPADWTAAGFDTLNWPTSVSGVGNVCQIDNTFEASSWFTTTFLNPARSTVWDTRTACPGGLQFSSVTYTWVMKKDIAFIANGFTLPKLNVTSADTTVAARRLWFITPDANLTNHQADCPAGASSTAIQSSVTLNAPVVGVVYTPCNMTISSNTWRGQIYAKTVAFNSNNTMTYIPVGLAGADMQTGSTTLTAGSIGDLLSIRDLNGG